MFKGARVTTGTEHYRAATAGGGAVGGTRRPQRHRLLGMNLDATSYQDASGQICDWAQTTESRYVCVANVHQTMETHDSDEFRRVVNNADMVTPDGVPLVWALRALGATGASRVYGPTLVLHLCEEAARRGIPVFLYGGTPESVVAFERFLLERYPSLKIAGSIAPPFRPLTPDEDAADTQRIAASGAGITFVGLGCPKQERWMAAHKGRVPGVMVGVGAAFDFHSGRVRQAPRWLSDIGLEWAFRLAMEPRRLWRRYLRHNPRFVALVARQIARERLAGGRA